MRSLYLIVTLGYPGSGKTFFSERLAQANNMVHLTSDKVRHEIYGEQLPFIENGNGPIFNLMNWFTEELLKKSISVIYDTNSNRKIYRKNYVRFAKKHNAIYVLVHIKTPLEVAEKRIQKRGSSKSIEKNKYYRKADISVLNKMRNEIELPSKKENVIEIDGTLSFVEQLNVFSVEIKKFIHYK